MRLSRSLEQCISRDPADALTVDPGRSSIDPRILAVLTRRQAWQFQLLPLYRDRHGLVAATTRENQSRAVRFASQKMDEPVTILLVEAAPLRRRLSRCYPWPAMMRMGRPPVRVHPTARPTQM